MSLDTTKLEQIIQILKNDQMKARVGVLGDKNARKDAETNSSIGMKHEFGMEGLPVRSFLRMPISSKFKESLEKAGFNKISWKKVIEKKSLSPITKRMGILGVRIVLEAFKTGGFGQWKPSIMKFKNTKKTLIETTQLRNSISYDLK